ncbi:alpha-L-rhamnosidase-related protein [Paenibacillus sp. strain BS8-2]
MSKTLIIEEFVQEAERLTPDLRELEVSPKTLVRAVPDDQALQGWRMDVTDEYTALQKLSFGKNEECTADFGDHLVGYVSFEVKAVGSPPDAPLKLKLIFGEMPCEIGEPFENYTGWLSSSWLQEEQVFVDVLPAVIRLPRRYSFRYMKIVVLDASRKYRVQISNITCTTVTSADAELVAPLCDHVPQDLADMDRIAIKTLQDCMQTVYEDGPKRDRRLWIGDLRLQAQANYLTFRDQQLVKRCLFLFAGMRLEDGAVGACVFEKPKPHVDDTRLFDYSLFFVSCLLDYYEATKDMETTILMWPTAMEQLRISVDRLDHRGIVMDDPSWWCFIDWHDDLNKQGPAQGVLIYALKQALQLARILDRPHEEAWITQQVAHTSDAAIKHLWDQELGMFVSGADRQISWATQVWLTLAGVMDQNENADLMDRLHASPPSIAMNTPYMMHHYVEALFASGLKDKAWEVIRSYWGEMVKDGADTFWELYNPEDKKLSPYGSNLINSYCHAWSCTPTYFIRKYWE